MSQANKVLFSVAEDEKLVELMSKYQCIYNSSAPEYKDHYIKEYAWNKISDAVQRSGNKISCTYIKFIILGL